MPTVIKDYIRDFAVDVRAIEINAKDEITAEPWKKEKIISDCIEHELELLMEKIAKKQLGVEL